MASRTPTTQEQEYIAVLGERLGRLMFALNNEAAWLNLKWNDYCVLFGTSEERVDLLNEAIPGFVVTMQDALWDDVLLHICRLTDPPKSVGRDNLSLAQLLPLVDPSLDLGTLAAEARDSAAFARDQRNRRLAHRDISIALEEATTPLETQTRAKVTTAVKAINQCLNAVHRRYRQTHVDYEGTFGPNGAERLLHHLKGGLRYHTELRERLKAGEISPEEFIKSHRP